MSPEIQVMFHTLLLALCFLISASCIAMSEARHGDTPGERIILVVPLYSLVFFIPLEIVFWTLYWMFSG